MKPNILYVCRDPTDWQCQDVRREYGIRDNAITEALSDKFSVATTKNLLTIKPTATAMFPFILTHLQNDSGNQQFTYWNSLATISQIHQQYPNTKIVVYTGASEHAITDDQLKEAGATAVIRKKPIKQLREDVDEVKTCLEALL